MLRGLSHEVARLAGTDFLVNAPNERDILADYELDLPDKVDLDELDSIAREWGSATQLGPDDDGHMAVAIRAALKLTPAVAADKRIWWWLTLVRYPEVALARWNIGGAGKGLRDRMLGTCGRNAFARLWWGAELVRGDSALTRKLFKNQDIFEAVIGRKLGRQPGALRVILEVLGDKPGRPARETLRDLQQVLSVVVLEGLNDAALREHLRHLWSVAEAASKQVPGER